MHWRPGISRTTLRAKMRGLNLGVEKRLSLDEE